MKNMMFSQKESIDYSISTAKTFGSRNLFALIMAIVAAVSDFALFIVFAVAGHGGVAIPIILSIIDGLYIAGVCLSNFRFKHSVWIWIVYLILSVTVTAILAALDSGETYMTDTAKYLNIFAHLALYLVTVFACIYPLFKNNFKLKAIMIAATAVAIILVGAFSIFFSANGYFGQGTVSASRVVGYTLDENSDTYIATSIKSGRSDKVIIPEEFNGKKVSGVSCSIFTHTSIKSVEVQSAEKIDLTDTQLLEYINQDLKIGVDKKYIDEYREYFLKRPSYTYPSALAPSYLTFSNSLYPVNLQEGEKYITFAYGEMPKLDNIVPTWIGETGEEFKLDFAGTANDYWQHADHGKNEDLIWCYYNNNSEILTGEMLNLAGSKINENIDKVKVEFENVYAIKIEEDNDSKYEPSDDLKNTTAGGVTYNYRFVTLDSANALLKEFSREGFDLGWVYKTNKYESFKSFENLRDTIYYFKGNMLFVRPMWVMKDPTDLAINFDKSGYVYGDDIKMSVSAKAANSDFKLHYDWSYNGSGGNSSLTGESYSITNALPQYGTFSVIVTVTYENSSLSSDREIDRVLQVGKKPLHIAWSQPDDMVYNYFEKPIGHHVGEDELINGDVLANYITETDVRNIDAGDYIASITLKGRIDDLYYIASGATYAYTIAPRPTTVEWTYGDYTYDGAPHNASATAKNLFGNDLTVNVSPAKINAGKHTALATCSDSNYQLTDNTFEFVIKQKSVEIESWDNSPLTYSGVAQCPRVLAVSGLVGNDNVNSELIYYGANIDAGEGYTVRVELPATSNYKFDSEQSTSYNINKRDLKVKTVAFDKTYDGNKAEYYFVVTSGLASVHTKDNLGAPIYGGDGADAVDVGSYTLTVSFSDNSVTKNYNITYQSCTFTINKATVALTWYGLSVDDNLGKVTPPSILTGGQEYWNDIAITGYIYKDGSGRVIDSIPYENGTYSVEVIATSKNYTFINTGMTFRVNVSNVEKEVA